MHNERHLKNTPEYRSGMFRIVSCPVCGHPTLDMYWICAHCGWEYDNELQTEDEESPCNGICTALPELIELVRHIALRGWEQVGVVVGDIDAFVSHPVSNRYRRIAHFNQK